MGSSVSSKREADDVFGDEAVQGELVSHVFRFAIFVRVYSWAPSSAATNGRTDLLTPF